MSPATATTAPLRCTARDYAAVRRASVAFTRGMAVEDMIPQSMPDASPVKWHLAHVTWFFEEFVLGPHVAGYRPHDEGFRYLFNSYYEAVGARHPRPERGLLTRPTVDRVLAWRDHVDAAMIRFLEDGGAERCGPWLIALGLAHEEQHQELMLTDLLHLLARHPDPPAVLALRSVPDGDLAAAGWVRFDGGVVRIGHPVDDPDAGFAFDCEGPRHRALVEPFRLANRPVTNGEWLAFVEDGGYRRPGPWLSDGWATVQAEGWEAPLHWRRVDGAWHQVTLAGLLPLDPEAPVCHVSYYEADAFATWAGARLPSEAEWEVAAAGRDPAAGVFADPEAGVHRTAPVVDDGTEGPQGLFGTVWEWTRSPYGPYPGFSPAAGAVGEYNGKFMCGQIVLRGGSWATPRGHVRATYRNFFYPHQRWQALGVRLAGDG